MPMTITEKILARAAGRESVSPGELIMARVDFCLGNDITAPVAIDEFEKAGFASVFDAERIALIPDHFTPNKDIKTAELVKQMREFAAHHGITHFYDVGRVGVGHALLPDHFTPNKDIKTAELVKQMREFAAHHGITHFYDVGRVGVEHALLPEMGLVGPGDVVVGADSHTCTYGALGAFATGVGSTDLAGAMATGQVWFRVPESLKFVFDGELSPWVTGKDLILYTIGNIGVDGALYMAMEFTGSAISGLSMDSRFSIANMAIEAGAKNGIIAADAVTRAYVEGRFRREPAYYESDTDADYVRTYDWRAADVPLMVAKPHLPSNTEPAADLADVHIDQVVIGSCTNGRIEDLRMAAHVLRGQKVHKDVRCIVIPALSLIHISEPTR